MYYAGVCEFDLQVFERFLYALFLFALPYFLLTLCFSLPSQRRREAERRQTLVTTAASCDAARALLERAHLTAFHHGSHLRELFHPKGSASGQASWDAV